MLESSRYEYVKLNLWKKLPEYLEWVSVNWIPELLYQYKCERRIFQGCPDKKRNEQFQFWKPEQAESLIRDDVGNGCYIFC
jgi:hypothetical protein